jgi:hypothetical protein
MKIKIINDITVKGREDLINNPSNEEKDVSFKKGDILEIHEIYEVKNGNGLDEINILEETKRFKIKTKCRYFIKAKDYIVISNE